MVGGPEWWAALNGGRERARRRAIAAAELPTDMNSYRASHCLDSVPFMRYYEIGESTTDSLVIGAAAVFHRSGPSQRLNPTHSPSGA